MTVCNLSPLRLPRMLDQKLLTLRWHSFSGWGSEHLSGWFDHMGGQYIERRQWCSRVSISRFSVESLNAIVNRKSWITDQEIGTSESCETPPNLQVDGSGSGFGLPWCRMSCFGWFWNRNETFVRCDPRLLASYLRPLLTPHPHEAIMQYGYWHPESSSWIQRLNHQGTGGKWIWILMITTSTQRSVAVQFGYWISVTGGVNKKKCTGRMMISLMWHTI